MKLNNQYLSFILFALPLLMIFTVGCEDSVDSVDSFYQEGDSNYPTVLYPLSEKAIQQLQTEFDSLNHSRICSKINKYGFIGNDTYHRAYQDIPISKDSALILAVNTLIKNSKFVNVDSKEKLLAGNYKITQLNSEGTGWRIMFGPQIYNGFELPLTFIYVRLYGNEPYSISGHWYTNIYIPARFKINEEAAKDKVVGEKIKWYGVDGSPREFIVTSESISSKIIKTIIPVEGMDSIELRVIWKIPIIIFPNGGIGWHIFLDVMTGEIIEIIQEFRS